MYSHVTRNIGSVNKIMDTSNHDVFLNQLLTICFVCQLFGFQTQFLGAHWIQSYLVVEPPIWKICSSNWESFPHRSGVKIPKHIWSFTTDMGVSLNGGFPQQTHGFSY